MRKPCLTNEQWNAAARKLAGLDELPDVIVPVRGVDDAAELQRASRGQIVGFVGQDGNTHAERGQRGGITKAGACGRVEKYWPQCPMNPASYEVRFIANPRHPLCLACVAAIEDEIRGEKE